MSSLCRNYTKALLDSSAVEKATHFVKLLEKLSKYFEYEEFIKVIESPAIPRASKENFIFSIVDIKDSQFINFIRVLNENNRIFLIPYIHRDLVQLMRIYSNEYEMIVYSSFKLSESELSMIRDFVSNKINTSLHIIEKHMDDEGIKVFVNDAFIEISFLKSMFLRDLKSHIMRSF